MPGRPRSLVGDEARQYCQKYPTSSNLQLARMLRRDNPRLFSSIESARTAVRYYRGACGKANLKKMEGANSGMPRIELPEPEPTEFAKYQLPGDIGRWLVLADLHLPYHDSDAIKIVLAWAAQKKNRCDGLLLLGDFADCYALSRWLKDPRMRRFEDELSAAGQMLGEMKRVVKPKRIIWKAGNHEDRLEKYLMSQAPELFGLPQFTFKSFLKLDEMGIDWVDAMHPIEYHNLTILHGHEWRGGFSSPVNPARTAYLKTRECCIIAHQHRTSEHTEPTLRGTTVTCWSVGCLCDLHPRYSPLNLWNHGFAVVELSQGWRIHNYRIVNGDVV
ncbi:MAG TPA: metallophosphoesterase [Phycisphaerae bacterium]|nr:metallophosphoesterase [Phycisphaerae bacterium]